MKKKGLLIAPLLAVSLMGANMHPAYADTVKVSSSNYDSYNDNKISWEQALKYVKDPKAREAIKREIEKEREKQKARDKAKQKEKEMKSDRYIVASDKALLTIGFAKGDSLSHVTQALNLSTSGKLGSKITWKSSNTNVLSNDGKTINRQRSDVKVVLTAKITKNRISTTKQFTVIVKHRYNEIQITEADKNSLTIGFNGNDTATSVTQPLKLPLKGKYGSNITWTSSNVNVISNDGKVIVRPANEDVKVILTATLTKGNSTVAKTFEVTVRNQLIDTQIVAADKEALAIGFSGMDTVSAVTGPIILPTKGANGSQITWVSSAPNIISHNGKVVHRPVNGQGDVNVTLIAKINNNGIADVKIFSLIVKQQLNDLEKVTNDKVALTVGFKEGDNENGVTGPISLPKLGANGSIITWISSSPKVLSHDGKKVIRPTAGSGDVAVTLIASIRSKNITEVKTFNLVVKQELTDAQKVAADMAALTIGFSGTDTLTSVTNKLSLPYSGPNGSIIVWYSSNSSIITDSGKVNRPAAGSGDKTVTLSAIIITKTSVQIKPFTVTVKQL